MSRGSRSWPSRPAGDLYTASGRRRLLPAIAFGAGVFAHLVRRRGALRRRALPVVPVLLAVGRAAGPGGRAAGPRLFVEWLECLSPGWWRAYAGRVGGAARAWPSSACASRLTPAALVFSDHTAAQLRAAGLRGEPPACPASSPGREPAAADAARDERAGALRRPPHARQAARWRPSRRWPLARERRPGLRGGDRGGRAGAPARARADPASWASRARCRRRGSSSGRSSRACSAAPPACWRRRCARASA